MLRQSDHTSLDRHNEEIQILIESDMNEIRERVKKRRIHLKLSYQDLAEKTGMSKSTLQRYETGAIRNLPVDKLEVLAKALGTRPGYLMGWESHTENAVAGNFSSPTEAMEFILKQPVLMNYGGYDITQLSDEDIVNFANELVRMLELVSHKYKGKSE